MKRLIILMCTMSALIVAQDAAGQYKLSGVNVLYTYVARYEATLTVSDAYGLGIQMPVATIPAGVPFNSQAMQLTDVALAAVGINLNVTLNEDGSGSIAEGSFYPDVNTIHDDNGNCITLQQVLPVTDNFTYTSMANMMEYAGFAHPGVNVLGLPGISSMAGQQIGGLGLSGSLTFEDYPMIPTHPTLCDPSGTSCFPFTVGDLDGSGTIEVSPDVNLLGIPEYVPGGAPLAGLTGGFFMKNGLNGVSGLTSVYPGNTDPDFYLEWHGVDGASAGLGQGPYADGAEEEDDEDLDGTWFDRELGIPGITATYMSAACGFSLPIYGDVTDTFEDMGLGSCVESVDLAASGYLMDASLALWGGFLTANAAGYSGCLASGADMATCGGLYGADDSDHDFNGTDGRLTMNFDIPCVPIIEAREVVAEFIEVGGGECGSGDVNADGGWNVLDVVALVNCVLADSCTDCSGDVNNDGGYNVLDVVALVNCVLTDSCAGRVDGATSAEFNVKGNEVTMTADGYVGAVEMTLSHGKNFALTLTDNALVAQSLTEGNTTKLMIVEPAGTSLFTVEGDFSIETVIAASNGETYMQTSVNNIQLDDSNVVISELNLSEAHPNPFNPTTSMTLAVPEAGYVSVKVYNVSGQLVATLASGHMDANASKTLTWDASNVSSGMYFVKAEAAGTVTTQKLMLMK